MIGAENLKELLDYNPDTGIFVWKVKPCKNVMAGDIAGTVNRSVYRKGRIVIKINGKNYFAHRLAWLYVHGSVPKLIDHINGDATDNRMANLRACNFVQNAQNSALKRNNSSGAKNVRWDKDRSKWVVRLRTNGKYKHIGRFDDFELADLVAAEAREKYHGNFARHC